MNLLHLLIFSEETIQMLNMLLMEIEYLFRLLSFINMLFITILSILTLLLAKLWQCHTSLPITYACKSLTFLSSCSLHRLFSAVWQNVFWLTNFWQFISHFGESFRITSAVSIHTVFSQEIHFLVKCSSPFFLTRLQLQMRFQIWKCLLLLVVLKPVMLDFIYIFWWTLKVMGSHGSRDSSWLRWRTCRYIV